MNNIFIRIIRDFNKIIMVIMLCSLFFHSCSGREKSGSTDLSKVLSGISSAKNFDEIKKYYTKKTLNSLSSSGRGLSLSETDRFKLLAILNNDMKWRVEHEKVECNKASMGMIFLEHPVENMRGNKLHLKFEKEGGAWKIDMENDIRKMFSRYNKKNGSDYLEKKFKSYQ